MKGYQFKQAVETTLRKLESTLSGQGRRFKIKSIEWSPIQTACVSPRFEIKLADVADHLNVNNALLDKYLGFVIHEILHVMYTDFKPNASTPYLAQMFNAVEDVRIERKAIKDQILGNVEAVLSKTIDQMVSKAMDQVTDWADPRQYPFAFAVFGRRYARPVPLAEGLEPIFKQASAMIDSAHDSSKALEIAEWIIEQLNNIDDVKPQDKPQGEQQGEGDPQDGAQDGTGEPQSDQTGEGEGEVSDDQQSVPTASKARKPDLQDAREVEPQCKIKKGVATGGTYSKDTAVAKDNFHTHPNRFNDLDVSITPKLRFEVRKLFESSGTDEFEHGHKRGRLNVSAIASISTGKANVFKRHLEEGGIDSAVAIAIDVSDSMCGSELDNAVKTAYALIETLEQARVATAVFTFGDCVSMIKPFGMNVRKAKQVIQHVRTNGGTNDYFAIKFGHDMLYNRSEARKILFVVTDGDGHVQEVKRQVQSGSALGVTTIGIGIGVDVSRVYANSITVLNHRDLGNASFKQIKLA
jgi:uncharacterized protein YegL